MLTKMHTEDKAKIIQILHIINDIFIIAQQL